jgi:hypothetical protein
LPKERGRQHTKQKAALGVQKSDGLLLRPVTKHKNLPKIKHKKCIKFVYLFRFDNGVFKA